MEEGLLTAELPATQGEGIPAFICDPSCLHQALTDDPGTLVTHLALASPNGSRNQIKSHKPGKGTGRQKEGLAGRQ